MKIVAIDHVEKKSFFIDTNTARIAIRYFPTAELTLESGDVHPSFIPDTFVVEKKAAGYVARTAMDCIADRRGGP